MVAHSNSRFVSPEEYLSWEDAAEFKSEYYDGVIVAMAGGSAEHDRVTVNILAALHAQLSGTNCEPFSSNMRVVVPARNRYYYPDLSVACDEPKFEVISGVQSLQNPAVVVEVLSTSTEGTDLSDKLVFYLTIPSLQQYVVVAQDRPLAQVYERQPDGGWRFLTYNDLEATVEFSSIGCRIPLRDIYARVSFPPQQEAGNEGTAV